MQEFLGVFKKYTVFSGRSPRREFWMFVLFNIIISIALSIMDSILGLKMGNEMGILSSVYSLAVLIPSLAVGVRRLHDTNHSGWWYFIMLVPIIGFIVLIVFWATDSTAGSNDYGQSPKGASAV